MKKILISLLFVLVSAVSANAQLLYRVSGADLKKPSYVFGTFHFANSPFVDQVAGVRQALDATDQVYGELNFDVMLKPGQYAGYAEAHAPAGGQDLEDGANPRAVQKA